MSQTKKLVKHIKAYKRASGMRADAVIEKLVEAIVEDGQGATILGMFDLTEIGESTKAPAPTVKIDKYRGGWVSSHKQWSLDPNLSAKDINNILGSDSFDCGKSDDGKCRHTWEFVVDGQYASIWDYKGSRWSGYGPREVFDKLGIRIVG